MKTLYIHVGAGKTGTTALQQFFLLNRHLLEQKGIWLPSIGSVKNNKTIAHHDLSGVKDGLDFDPRPLWEKLKREAKNKDSIVVSSENFHSRVRYEWGQDLLNWVRSKFTNWRVVCIYYIRRQDQWNESAYEQWIKDGTLRDGSTVDDFVQRYHGNQPKEIFILADILGQKNVIVRPYQNIYFKGGTIFSDFLWCIGLEWLNDYIVPAINANPRLSLDALEYKRISNSVLQTKKDAQYLLKPLVEYSKIEESTKEIYRNYTLVSV